MAEKYFITGIGTDIGKSYATGWLANKLAEEGKSVITQKFIQTGNKEMSEDILLHRKIMNIPLQTEDLLHITAPVILSYPASPHLAAKIDNTTIDLSAIEDATEQLARRYDVVLIEGAGGVMVPVTESYLTIDYIRDHNLPVVVVTNGQLGSISDTLLTLEALQSRAMRIAAVIYNSHFDSDTVIAAETRTYLGNWVKENIPSALWFEM
ncbi:MAG: dethiobiotin synthase [Muribaculaceae bacterium]|nr:dethiobiotin synthase [Muribaculaceae bacterium]